MISLTNTEYASLQYGSRRHGKSLAFSEYQFSKAGTSRDNFGFRSCIRRDYCRKETQKPQKTGCSVEPAARLYRRTAPTLHLKMEASKNFVFFVFFVVILFQ
jgi:hypothetical protein